MLITLVGKLVKNKGVITEKMQSNNFTHYILILKIRELIQADESLINIAIVGIDEQSLMHYNIFLDGPTVSLKNIELPIAPPEIIGCKNMIDTGLLDSATTMYVYTCMSLHIIVGYNIHELTVCVGNTSNRWTPLLLEYIGYGWEYYVRGIGTSQIFSRTGLHTCAFEAVSGSSKVVHNRYYLGWCDHDNGGTIYYNLKKKIIFYQIWKKNLDLSF